MRWTKKQLQSYQKGKTIPSTANDLNNAVVKYLSLKGYKVWRQNNVSVYDEKLGEYRKFTGEPGVSDVIGWNKKNGVWIAVEGKAGDDQLSPDQINFLHSLNKAGGLGILARSLDDVINIIEKKV